MAQIKLRLRLEEGHFMTVKADLIEQNILPEYQFAIHKTEPIYTITEVSTGAMAFVHLGQKGDSVKAFLAILAEHKELYKAAIIEKQEQTGVKTVVQRSLF
jgi:hypothetical protein